MWVGKKLQKEVMENILDERVFNSLKELSAIYNNIKCR